MRYFSTIQHVDGVIGNSSSGLAEVPSFKKGTINIGDRQKGRLKANSVIDCDPTKHSISRAIVELYSTQFQKQLVNTRNPYGEGGSVEKIVKVIKNIPLDNLLKKKFYNLKIN